jgi:hypothetical protein
MNQSDDTMKKISAAVELGHRGERARARADLQELWEHIGGEGDALHRCTLAHHLADLQDSDEAELEWDERALAAAGALTDERAQRFDESLYVRGFLPSLHLNLADDHRRLGHPDRAREHLTRARELSAVLPDDGYGATIRAAIDNVAAALEKGTTHRLASSPSTSDSRT